MNKLEASLVIILALVSSPELIVYVFNQLSTFDPDMSGIIGGG